MSKIEENYEEQVRKEFESTQEPEEVQKEFTTKNLGRVELSHSFNNDPEIERIKAQWWQ